MTDEAKQDVQTVEPSVDEKMDAIFDEHEGKEKPAESSSDSLQKPVGEETDKEAEATVDPDNAKKEAEADKEPDIPQEFHKHDAWIRMKEAKDTAIAEATANAEKLAELEKSGVLSEEDKALLENVKQFTSSRQFVEDKYKREGYTKEAIDGKLADEGFEVATDDLEVAAKALNLDVNTLGDQDKQDISNLVKISNALMQNQLQKVLPAIMNPISEQVAGLTSKDAGLKVHDEFVSKVKEDGILDFNKDLAPDVFKYLDDNPEANQQDVAKFMQDTYHAKLVLHNKAVTKKGERDLKAEGNRPGGEGAKVSTTLPDKTGDYDKDADALFDHLGIQ